MGRPMAWVGSHSGWGSSDSSGLVAKIVLWYCTAMDGDRNVAINGDWNSTTLLGDGVYILIDQGASRESG